MVRGFQLCLVCYCKSVSCAIYQRFSLIHSVSLSDSEEASDQGQVLVIVTAAVGGFSLLVILTLFLLITGRY